MSLPKPDDDEPRTFFEIEQRRLHNPGEPRVGADVASLPPQPASSPWAAENQPEPPVDRSEDGDAMNVRIDDLNR
jgi:hypothetical protein